MNRPTAAAGLVLGLAAASIIPNMMRQRGQHMQRLHDGWQRTHTALTLPPAQFFNQTLDHMNALNLGWWQQRFWVNASFWTQGTTAPVFLYLEGEGTGSAASAVRGQHVELAGGYGALVVVLEHRFFGASIPTPDLTLTSMGFLTSDQAVGDVARFISEYIVPTFGIDPAVNKIVTFGGSYPGALSAWVRLRLPHLVGFAFSTSSPVQAQFDFPAYCGVVSAALANAAVGGSDACLAAVTAAFAAVDTALRGSDAQQAAIATQMHSCGAPNGTDDVKLLASNLASVLMGVVQYNDESGGPDVAAVCSAMTAPGADPATAFAAIVLQTLGGAGCMDNSYADFIFGPNGVGNTTADPAAQGVGIRQWTWMTCVQFAYFQTCEADCPFSALMDLASQVKICTDGFGPAFDAAFVADRVRYTNDALGGGGFAGSNTLFVNGGVDPWHNLSVTPYANAHPAANPTVWIPTGAHCRAMQPSRDSDPADVKAARTQSAALLAAFLQPPRH